MAGLAAETANLIVALKLDDSGFTGKLNSAARALKGMDRGLSQMGRGASQIGSGIDKLATRIGLAAAAAGGFVVTTAASFEQAEAGIRKTVGGTTEEVDALIDSIRDMSRRVPLSFEELAAITAEGGALGIANKNLDEFTEIVARLSVSTDLTVEAASSSLGKLANVLRLEDQELQDFGDMLVALGNDGASTESEILALTERFGAAGNQAGLSNAQILALSSTVASMGVEAEAGGGALSRLFNQMTLDIATTSEESEALADALGYSFGELRARWDRDAGDVFEELLGHLNELDKFEQAQLLSDLGITNTRDINAIQLLAEGVDEYQRQLGVAEGQTDELNRESDVFFNTTQGKWEILKNNVRLAADTIGSELLPVVNELIDDFVGWLSDPKTQQGLRDFARDLGEGVRDVVREIKSADLTPLVETLKGAAGFAKGAFDAFMALPADLRNLLLGFIAVNKVTGGALSDIVKGVGNLTMGGLKVALSMRGQTPANPLFVADVTGGLGGGPVGGGKGGKGGGKFPLLPVAGAVGVALSLSSSEFGGTPQAQQQQLVTDLWQRGLLTDEQYQTLFKLAYEGVDISPRLAGVSEGGGIFAGLQKSQDAFVQKIEAKSFDEAMLQRAVRQGVSELPDTAMLAPAVQALTTNLPPIRTKQDQALLAQYQALAAARGTTAEVGRLANTPHNVFNDVTVPVSVTVNASVIAQQTYRARTSTRGTDGQHHSGGFI